MLPLTCLTCMICMIITCDSSRKYNKSDSFDVTLLDIYGYAGYLIEGRKKSDGQSNS